MSLNMDRKLVFVLILAVAAGMACSATNLATPTPQPQIVEPGDTPLPAETTAPPPNSVYLPSINSNEAGAAPGSEASPASDPQVNVDVSQSTLKVGDTLTVLGTPVDIGLPYYYLVLRDEGVQDDPPVVQVTYDNQVTPQDGSSQVLEFVSAEGQMNQVKFVLRAISPGVTTITINATGELHSAEGVSWSGGGSGTVMITVTR
jgi:hypothetical protein